MTDLTGGARYGNWRDLVDEGLRGCACAQMVIDLHRDASGAIASAVFSHTDENCPAVLASIADAVNRITDPEAGGTNRT